MSACSPRRRSAAKTMHVTAWPSRSSDAVSNWPPPGLLLLGRRGRVLQSREEGPARTRDRARSDVMQILGYVPAITMAAAGTALGVLAVKALAHRRRYVAR